MNLSSNGSFIISPFELLNVQASELVLCRKATSVLINSIILTPGTVTVEVSDEKHFVVHALTDDAAGGLLEGTMQRKIAELFGEE